MRARGSTRSTVSTRSRAKATDSTRIRAIASTRSTVSTRTRARATDSTRNRDRTSTRARDNAWSNTSACWIVAKVARVDVDNGNGSKGV